MNTIRRFSLSFKNADLLPIQWHDGTWRDQFFIFNPAIVRYRGRNLMVYRVDFGHDRPVRVACAICALDQHWQVAPGSAAPLSDTIDEGHGNHYDPRFLVYGDRLFIR
jgi:predicted GH43/DUF377 family glycosyl hydrolase